MNSAYLISTLIGMVAMALGMFLTNKYSLMISSRIGMMISQAWSVVIIYIWIRVVDDKFLAVFKEGWLPISYVFLAGSLIAVGLLGLVEAFSKGGPGNVVIPIWGSYIVWASLLCTLFLKVPFTMTKGIGVGFVVLGIILVSL